MSRPFQAAKLILAAALFVACGHSAHAAETILLEEGSSMSYRANSSDPELGIAWTAEDFTPTGWSSGTYGVGYDTGSGALNLLTTTVPSPRNSVYTRSTFNITDVGAVENLFLGADYDDGYVAWVNGVEVYRASQMPGGTPAWDTLSGSHESSNGSSPNYGTLHNITAAALPVLHNGTNVLAIGVWNTTWDSSDLVLVPQLLMNRDALIRGPYLQMGTPSSVVVRWRTLSSEDSCVRYGASPASLTLSACSGASVTEHEIDVSGLTPDTKYFYSIGSSTETLAGGTAAYSFVTAPTIGTTKPTRVWVLGDSGTANADAADVRDAYTAFTGSTPTDLWLMLGDNAYNSGTDSEYQAAVFDMYPTMLQQSVLWPTLGNHDGYTANSSSQTGGYYDIFTLPSAAEAGGVPSGTAAYYSFDYGDIHFICLESYETDRSVGGDMMLWLSDDLADTTAKWIVAFFHHPPYSKGSHDSDTDGIMSDMREIALPVLEAGGVDLVLTGHSHSYERSFLLDGHYDVSSTLTPAMKLDAGSGQEGGTGAYQKTGGGPVADEGAVYIVAGSSGKVSAAALNHPAMHISMAKLGSVVLDFDDTRLDVQFIDETATQQDEFTIVKTPPPSVCGNGIPEAGEQCDDGNASNTDSCLDTCAAASCGDGFVHTGVEQCDDANADDTDACPSSCVPATCGDGFLQAGIEECDDGNVIFGDGCTPDCFVDCTPQPRTDCRSAGVSVLKVVDANDPNNNFLKWKWLRGPAVAASALGDPTVDAAYDVCLYANVPGAGAVSAEMLLAPGPLWGSLDERGFQYRDAAYSNGGIRDLRVVTGAERKTKLTLKARGANLPEGMMPATSYTVQLVDRTANGCWSSAFASGQRSPTLFKGKTILP